MIITYTFENATMSARAFEVTVGRSTTPRQGQAEWTHLTHHQCENCPLQREVFSHCPAAVDLEVVVEGFQEVLSHDEVLTTVTMPNGRELRRTGDTASAVATLLGLILASSACPILSRMKGLALTHVPFQTPNERVFRFIGAYFMGQFVEEKEGGEPDWSLQGLKRFFDEIETLNHGLIGRVSEAAVNNPSLDAIQNLMAQGMQNRDLLDSWDDEMDVYAMPVARSA